MADATSAAPMTPVDIADLQNRFGGELLRPGVAGYEEARRVWNGSTDRSPALIARCAGVADVIQAVNFASENGLILAVRAACSASTRTSHRNLPHPRAEAESEREKAGGPPQ